MKTSFFKNIFPALAIMLAVGGAYGTYAMNQTKSTSGAFPGYIKNNPSGSNCTLSTQCTDVIAELCTVNADPTGIQLYGLQDGACTVEVYRIHP